MDFSKFKGQLLKSSLPLELEAANGLAAEGFFIYGDFSYERKDESGDLKLFSVDVFGSWSISGDESKQLNLLVECKYSHEGNIWVFSTFPEAQEIYTDNLGAINFTNKFDFDQEYLNEFLFEHPFSPMGTVASERETNPDPIRKGFQQLRYAIPHVILGDAEWRDFVEVGFYANVLLTNAEIYQLNNNVTVEDVRKAVSLEEIARPVDALIISRDIDDDIIRYCDSMVGRMEHLHEAYDPYTINRISSAFRRSTSQIFVVRLNAFRDWVRELQHALNEVKLKKIKKPKPKKTD